jgi:hypothetical protein
MGFGVDCFAKKLRCVVETFVWSSGLLFLETSCDKVARLKGRIGMTMNASKICDTCSRC